MLRLGVVSFLNSRPLIAGLEDRPDVHCTFDVPARLAQYLDDGRVDVALLPVMDVLRGGGRYRVVSDGCIGCDGETMTVRVFSQVPPDRVTRVWADTDSHTSVVLAQVLWQALFGRRLELVPLEKERGTGIENQGAALGKQSPRGSAEPAGRAGGRQSPDRQGGVAGTTEPERGRGAGRACGGATEPRLPGAGGPPREATGGHENQGAGPPAVLLIGDKVVDPARDSYAYEVDLGAAWRSHTGLPFVFAVWARLTDRADLAQRDPEIDAILAGSRDLGVTQAADIARREAASHGWPVELALRYLCRCLRFRLDERMVAGANHFAALVAGLGLLPSGTVLVAPAVAEALPG